MGLDLVCTRRLIAVLAVVAHRLRLLVARNLTRGSDGTHVSTLGFDGVARLAHEPPPHPAVAA